MPRRGTSMDAELSEGSDGHGFVFPDDDTLVQKEFERDLPFARSMAKSSR